jgi:Tfp pilus assembly protein PilN
VSLAFAKLAVGADWDGGALNLVALGRRLRRVMVIGELRLPDARSEDAAAQVSGFLKRHRLQEPRVVACLPREAVLVRLLDLPAEAEPKLASVVGYQLRSLHPFPDGQVYWDCAVVARDAKTRQIRVLVALAEKSRLEEYRQLLQSLGLRASALTLAAAAMAPWIKLLLPGSALVLCGRSQGVEFLSFLDGNLCATQEIAFEPNASARERWGRGLHGALAPLPASDPAAIRCFVCGSVPSAFLETLPAPAELPPPKLHLTQPSGFDLGMQLPAVAAAYGGLVRRLSPSINLLPPEERWQPSRATRAPVYALGTLAALLALTAAAHGWIEDAFYGRALDRQIQAVDAPAQQVLRQSQQASNLAAREATLESIRAGDWQKLRILQELTRLLPDGTWLQDLQIGPDSLQMYGYSNHAADLVPPLENSPYFSQVEFTSPITRDNQNREIFRIRMRLKQSVEAR